MEQPISKPLQSRDSILELEKWLSQQIIGQEKLVNRLLIALLADGHLLVEGAPGLAKTKAIKTLGQAIEGDFHRIQFTPDLLPSDITGTEIYRAQEGSFEFQRGPIFHNLILADEINRAPAKVQSALLEAMQERQVTIGSETFPLPQPFLVLATQNPVEQEGTYPLPEAQVDRFMLKLVVKYPTAAQERTILDRMARTGGGEKIEPVMEPSAIADARQLVDRIFIDERIKDYIVALVVATRDPKAARVPLGNLLEYGASPRATISLAIAAKAKAFLDGRGYVVPQDVKDIAPDVLRHRLILSYEAEAEEKSADDLVKILLDHVPVP